jgi:hypothetical protein
MNNIVDFVESLARYLKARHIGEFVIFAISLMLLTWTVTMTLINSQNPQNFDGMAKNIQYFVEWLLSLGIHLMIMLVTVVVFAKGWGKQRLIRVCLIFQGISFGVLCLFLPLT